jgi:adenylate kinase family enzyme
MARRIGIVGISGSGKTTLARALAQRLGVPHVELDALHHGPSWTEASAEELRERALAAMAGGGWVVDGNYERKIGDVVLERADTLVWLDLPLPVALARLWRRTAARIRDDVELWSGNRESWRTALVGRESLFAWTVRSWVRQRRSIPARAARHPQLRLVRLRSPAAVERWFREGT